MRKVYYIYNPKTRTYDRIYPTMRQRMMSYLRNLFVGMGLGAGCFSILGTYIGTRCFDKGGAKAVKPLMIVVLCIFFIKVLWELIGG